MKLWWEVVNDISEDCKDLEWYFYNGAGILKDSFEMSESTMDESGPISEQIWAMYNGLA